MAKYDGLKHELLYRDGDVIELTMAEMDRLVDGGLPPTAYTTRAWWANNSDRHVQALAWLDAGWFVREVDFNSQIVRFSAHT